VKAELIAVVVAAMDDSVGLPRWRFDVDQTRNVAVDPASMNVNVR